LKLQQSKYVHTKLQLSSFFPDGFRQILDQFSNKFQDVLKKNSKISYSEKVSNSASQKASLAKILAN
jgi:hypothetical protein